MIHGFLLSLDIFALNNLNLVVSCQITRAFQICFTHHLMIWDFVEFRIGSCCFRLKIDYSSILTLLLWYISSWLLSCNECWLTVLSTCADRSSRVFFKYRGLNNWKIHSWVSLKSKLVLSLYPCLSCHSALEWYQ